MPVTIANVDLYGTPDELGVIVNFLLQAASEPDLAQANNSELSVGIEFENSNPTAGVGVWLNRESFVTTAKLHTKLIDKGKGEKS